MPAVAALAPATVPKERSGQADVVHGLAAKAGAAVPATTAGVTHAAPRTTVRLLGQPARLGVLPTLMAATADLPGSTYVGPSGLFQMRGLPEVVKPRRLARDEAAQRRLWELSEAATGLRYPLPGVT